MCYHPRARALRFAVVAINSDQRPACWSTAAVIASSYLVSSGSKPASSAACRSDARARVGPFPRSAALADDISTVYGWLFTVRVLSAKKAGRVYSSQLLAKINQWLLLRRLRAAPSALFAQAAPAAKMQSLLAALVLLTAAHAQKMTADIVSCPG